MYKRQVLDSEKHLPENWNTIDIKKEYGHLVEHVNDEENDLNVDGKEQENVAEATIDCNESILDATTSENSEKGSKKPKRVLIFTSVLLLRLLGVTKKGSVDGTFKVATKCWKQVFIMLAEFRGVYLPVAFGLLPDKTETSYKVFVILLMEAVKEINVKITMKRVMVDFELAIHLALVTLFKTRGCYFHFTQAVWKRVQGCGMVKQYIDDSKFQAFVRCVAALPFLPLTELEATCLLYTSPSPRD